MGLAARPGRGRPGRPRRLTGRHGSPASGRNRRLAVRIGGGGDGGFPAVGDPCPASLRRSRIDVLTRQPRGSLFTCWGQLATFHRRSSRRSTMLRPRWPDHLHRDAGRRHHRHDVRRPPRCPPDRPPCRIASSSSGRPSAVQIASDAPQSVVAGREMEMSPCPVGSTCISRRSSRPSTRRAFRTAPPETENARSRSTRSLTSGSSLKRSRNVNTVDPPCQGRPGRVAQRQRQLLATVLRRVVGDRHRHRLRRLARRERQRPARRRVVRTRRRRAVRRRVGHRHRTRRPRRQRYRERERRVALLGRRRVGNRQRRQRSSSCPRR